jgi:hypothetical protein
MIGRVQWSEDGLKFYKRSKSKFKQVYNNKQMMDIIYRGWEQWLVTQKKTLIPGESSSKTFHSIMATWTENEDNNCSNKGGKKGGLRTDSDSDDGSDDGDGYFSDMGTNQCTWDNNKSSTETLIHTSPKNSTARSNDDDQSWTKTSMGGTKSLNSAAIKKWNRDVRMVSEVPWIPRNKLLDIDNSEESEIELDDDKTKKIAGGRKSRGKTLTSSPSTSSPARNTRTRGKF